MGIGKTAFTAVATEKSTWFGLLTWMGALALMLVPVTGAAPENLARERAGMVRTIEGYQDQTLRILGQTGFSPAVLEAMRNVPRHAFVPESHQSQAYQDRALPIGYGQTISQPFIVALMTDLLRPEPEQVVLEVGTGSGYHAAVLAHLVKEVYTIEIVAPLAELASRQLDALGYENVSVRTGDGYEGWADAGPFDGILVTATADHVPPALIRQLKPGGRLVMPVGDPASVQHLTLVEIDENGNVEAQELLPVRFVPLTGGSR